MTTASLDALQAYSPGYKAQMVNNDYAAAIPLFERAVILDPNFAIAVEAAYRDARINRIFEGTNEINRLLITGMLLKRAARGQLALISAVQSVLSHRTGEASEETRLVKNAKKIALFVVGIAYQRYGAEFEKQQEVLMNSSDILMETFAMESTLLRTRKLAASGKGANGTDMCAVFLREAMDRLEISSRVVIGACASDNARRENMTTLRGFANYEP